MNGQQIVTRFGALESQRTNLDSALADIESYVVPYRGEFFGTTTSEQEISWRQPQLHDSTAPMAANLLASQMQGTMTSASVRWFGFRFRNQELNDNIEAKQWLEECEARCWEALIDSDFYTAAAEVFLDLASFGTSVIMGEEAGDGLLWKGFDFTTLPIQDTYFELDSTGNPTFVARRLRYTTDALVERFGADAVPESRKKDEEGGAGDVEERHEVIFCVYNRDIGQQDQPDDSGLILPKRRPVGYKYVHKASGKELEEGGYYEFPAMTVRWQKTAGSKWGYSPAMVCLSNIKQLNAVVANTAEARAKQVDPPYKTTERGVVGQLDLEPGGLTMVTEMDQLEELSGGGRPIEGDIERQRLQQSIRECFYLDWLDLKESPAMTATEVHARRENQRRLMGPVVGRIQSDFLEPLLELVFETLNRKGQLPEQPENTDREELDIEYVGELARAQKADVAMGLEAWLQRIVELAEIQPNVMDLPNWDSAMRNLAMLRGVQAQDLNTEADVEAMRESRAQQEEQRQEIETKQQIGEAGKAMGEAAASLGLVSNEA